MTHVIERLAQTSYTFVLMNLAAVVGLYQYLHKHEGFWNITETGGREGLRRA